MSFPRAGVIGWPIHHSRSPFIHTHWLEELDISGSYEAIAVSPDDAGEFFQSFKSSGLKGVNITIPHKETVMSHLDHLSEAAEIIGAVNTIWLENGHLNGDNSDWCGFLDNLDQQASGWQKQSTCALVLGAGGAARGILYALQQRGFQKIYLANRTLARGEALASHFGASIEPITLEKADNKVAEADLVVNTTSLGMDNNPPLPLTLHDLDKNTLVTDIVYSPLQTPLLTLARSKGNKTVDGLGMLLHQAKLGFEKWFGHKPEVDDELRQKVLADMGLTP